MKFVTYAENSEQLKKIHKEASSLNIDLNKLEVIVGTNSLSRFSENSFSDLMEMISLNQTLKLPLLLEWDILAQENRFKNSTEELLKLPLHEFIAIRLQDPGAVNFIKSHFPWLKIQLILENGNHNFEGLCRWSDFLGEQLDRLILSNELSREHLVKYSQSLKAKIEVLAFGRILLFYSPRLLLSPLKKSEISENLKAKNLEAYGTSEESPHSGFPLIENAHGTFMFNVKDLSLIEHINELKEMNVEAVRFDLRFDNSLIFLEKFLSHALVKDEVTLGSEIKSKHPRALIKGFYNVNKSDVLFPKLKNSRIQRFDTHYLGEVIDVERDEQITLMIKSEDLCLNIGDSIRLVTPEGKIKISFIKELKNISKENLNKVSRDEICTIPYLSGIVAKTQVYLEQKT
ncbi:MAG: hypothetical protein HOP07_02595 [Bacteriovoracaceae bacterium]|nr:hypothetical protein [Bacteriovoracaceae bacterium]